MKKIIALMGLLIASTGYAATDSGDTAFVMIAAALVLAMTPGLAFFYGGMVERKNVVGMLFQNWVAFPILGLLWAIAGYSLSFSGDFSQVLLSGVGAEPLEGGSIPSVVFMAFQMMFAIITPILMTGAIAERASLKAWMIIMAVWSFAIYYPVCNWVWGGGWISKLGAVDFAGGYVVHMTAGFSALALAVLYGRRKKFGQEMLPYDTSMISLGTALLWFGWFGFNAGSALAANGQAGNAFGTTFFSAAAAFATWSLVDRFKDGKPTLTGACIGAVVGLVVITPGAGFVSLSSSIIMGALGGVICNFVARAVKGALNIDDSLDVFACHGVGGLLGILLTGVFAQTQYGGVDGLIAGNGQLLVNQAIGALAVAFYSIILTAIIAKVVGLMTPLRVEEKDEEQGLDQVIHGEQVSSRDKMAS